MKKILLSVEDKQKMTKVLSVHDVDLACVDFSNIVNIYEASLREGVYTDIILQINEGDIAQAQKIISHFDIELSRVLILTRHITPELTKYLKAHGLAHLMTVDEFYYFPEYVLLQPSSYDHPEEVIFLHDDNQKRIRLIRSIVQHFSCGLHVASSQDELFDLIRNMRGSLVVNLGAAGFNIKEFVNRAITTDAMKYTPFIPFKSRDEGVYAEEIYSGLHRFARVILSTDELYSFLVDILFKKAYFSCLKALVKEYDYHDHISFVESSLKKLYYSFGADLFAMEHIASNNMFGKIDRKVKELQEVMVKVAGLKWLLHSTGSQATCGLGGEIQNLL